MPHTPVPAELLRAADPRWEAFAAREPYFAVLTAPALLRARLTDAARQSFYATGEALVAAAFRTIELSLAPDFAPTAILEYGCGAGRLALPLARRASRRGGTVTAVDRSAAMIAAARGAAAEAGVTNIRFETPSELFGGSDTFDCITCYLVLQRLPVQDGVALVRALCDRLAPGGIALFQAPYSASASAAVRTARWIRERLPIANGLVNLLKAQPFGQPFVPSHVYALEPLLQVFEDAGIAAVHTVFDDHADLSSAMLIVLAPIPQRPDDARAGSLVTDGQVAGPLALAPPASNQPIDVRRIIAGTSLDDLNRTAEHYFASLTDWDHHLAKPFSSPDEAPWLLTNLAVLLQGLELVPGATVLEFGAGTGWLSRFLTQLGCRVVLLDVSPTALRMARTLYERVPVIGDRPAPVFLEFDGRRIDLSDESVDRIVSFHAFHHAPNPDEVLAEFGRVLRPGGRAVFAEPGPRHSATPQSQFEMRRYGVVENDIDIHEIWRIAARLGFADIRLFVFHGLPFAVSLDEYEGLLRGGPVADQWTGETRVFLRNVRNFVLVKAGRADADSRRTSGLACDIHVGAVPSTVAAEQPFDLEVRITNTGGATWLPSAVTPGGVSLGVRLSAEGHPTADREIVVALTESPTAVRPGDAVTVRVTVPPLGPGRYTAEIDCVAADVTWFSQVGKAPVTIEFDVKSQPKT